MKFRLRQASLLTLQMVCSIGMGGMVRQLLQPELPILLIFKTILSYFWWILPTAFVFGFIFLGSRKEI